MRHVMVRHVNIAMQDLFFWLMHKLFDKGSKPLQTLNMLRSQHHTLLGLPCSRKRLCSTVGVQDAPGSGTWELCCWS